MPTKQVDTAALFAVGPGIDSTDGASLEEAIAHNATGMDAILFEETQAGLTATALTPTTGGAQDWTHVDGGNYSLEITAAQLDTEGGAWVQVKVNGVLVMVSPYYEVVDPADADALSALLANVSGGAFTADAFAASFFAALITNQHTNAGTAQAGAATTITLATGASASDDTYNGQVIILLAGTGAVAVNVITGYVGATKVATVAAAWATNPDNTTRYVILDIS